MLYEGRVTRVAGNKLYVTISDRGTSKDVFGPLDVVAPTVTISMVDYVANTFVKGDRVIVGQIGRVKEDLVVIGKLAV